MLDLIIIGASAAGGSAAIYSARRKLNFKVISDDFGGEMARSGEIWNYPGFPQTDGIALTEQFREHLKANGVEPELGVRVESVTKREDGTFLVAAKKGGEDVSYEALSVIVSTGVHPRHLGVTGEEEYIGKGVTYCTTCDGPLYRNKKVVTIGGGNSALESALMLAEIAEHVTVVNINPEFTGERVLADKLKEKSNVDIITEAETTSIVGSQVVEGVEYKDKKTGEAKTVPTQGVFVHIGLIPNSAFLGDTVETNKFKEIVVDGKCKTSVEGLFAAGDVTNVPYKQIAVATGQGVTAALAAIEYINNAQQQ